MLREQEQKYVDHALDAYEWHTRNYDRYYRKKSKVPKNFAWRPYRFCVRDVVLGMVVVKHFRKDNLLGVDVCVSTDINVFPPLSGAKVVSSFLLSEAFKCGGSMEIRFTHNVQGGKVPTEICDLALELDVELNHVREGHITPAEARKLYLAITDFSDEALERIKQLAVETELSAERVCYMVHHGIWTTAEMEAILLGSTSPQRVLLGESLPETRHLYLNDLTHARAALLGGFLDRKLAHRERGDNQHAIELEGDQRRIKIGFDPRFYAKNYQSPEQLLIPWVDSTEHTIPSDHLITVMVRPRNTAGLGLHFHKDIKTAKEMRKAYTQSSEESTYGFILVPRDFEDLPMERQTEMRKAARKSNIFTMVCPETVQGLDEDAARRLERSRTLRR